MKINTVAVSEKGALKPAVRKAVLDTQTPALNEVLGDMGFVAYPEQKAYALPITDASGNTIYLTLSVTVGLKAPNEKAERKARKWNDKADICRRVARDMLMEYERRFESEVEE